MQHDHVRDGGDPVVQVVGVEQRGSTLAGGRDHQHGMGALLGEQVVGQGVAVGLGLGLPRLLVG